MQILTLGRDAALQLLDARTLEATARIVHPSLRVGYNWSRAAFSPDGAFATCGSLNGTVLVWDLAEGGGRWCRMEMFPEQAKRDETMAWK